MDKYTGKLIVIDGTDGSGKTTQVSLLAERFKSAGIDVKIADFPQYGHKSAGAVEEYLSGKYGRAEMVNPYISSIFYAIDRYDASFKIKKWLKDGKIVISNRYTSSNMAHQGGKISNPLERKAFFDWIRNLEEKVFGIPKPDLIFFLHVDSGLAQNLAVRRNRVDWEGKINDIHEENIKHLQQAEKTYIEIAQYYNDITLFSCMNDDQLLPREEINDWLWKKISCQVPSLSNTKVSVLTNETDNNNQGAEESPVIRIKKLSSQARLPERSTNDNGLNFFSYDYHSIQPGENAEFLTGVSLFLPNNYAGIIMNYDQSAMKEISVLPFIVSPNHNKEITIKIMNISEDIVHIPPGRIIAKLIIQKTVKPLIVNDDYDIF